MWFFQIEAEILGLLHDVSLTQRPGAAEMTSHRRDEQLASKWPGWPSFKHFTVNCYNMSRICQQTRGPFPYFIVKVTIWSDVVRPIGAEDSRDGPIGEEDEAEPPVRVSSYPPSWGQSDNGLHEIGLIASSQDCVSTSSNTLRVTFHSWIILLKTVDIHL